MSRDSISHPDLTITIIDNPNYASIFISIVNYSPVFFDEDRIV